MTQYKITTKEDIGGGICKMTFEDKYSDTAWGRSVTEAVNAALVEQGLIDKEEALSCKVATWSLTVWLDTLEAV